MILPDGSERPIARPGPPSILEQARLVRLGADLGVRALVAEVMGIRPETMAAETRRILRPGLLVLTNARADHLDDMGATRDAVAASLAAAIPPGADVLVPEEEVHPVFRETAARLGSRLAAVPAPAEGNGIAAGLHLPYEEFAVNLRLAAAAAEAAGIAAGPIRRGMEHVIPDFGSLKMWRVDAEPPAMGYDAVSAFAANEPESTRRVFARVRERLAMGARPLVALLNLRVDRGDRTRQWLRAFEDGLFGEFELVALIGGGLRPAERRFRAGRRAGSPRVISLRSRDPRAVMSGVLAESGPEPVVVGMVNMVGLGARLVEFWESQGTRHGG